MNDEQVIALMAAILRASDIFNMKEAVDGAYDLCRMVREKQQSTAHQTNVWKQK